MRAAHDVAVEHALDGSGDADVDRHDVGRGHLGHDADARTAKRHVARDRRGDLLARLRDPLGNHAVVGAERHDGPLGERDARASRDGGDLRDVVLEHAQAANGLGDGVPVVAGALARVIAGLGDLGCELVETHGTSWVGMEEGAARPAVAGACGPRERMCKKGWGRTPEPEPGLPWSQG